MLFSENFLFQLFWYLSGKFQRKKCKGVLDMRKKYTSEFKAKVALEAVKGEMTLSELSQKYEVHPNMIANWKSRFLKEVPRIFSDKRLKDNKSKEVQVDDLYKQIGVLQVEKEFLRKKYKQIFGKEPDL